MKTNIRTTKFYNYGVKLFCFIEIILFNLRHEYGPSYFRFNTGKVCECLPLAPVFASPCQCQSHWHEPAPCFSGMFSDEKSPEKIRPDVPSGRVPHLRSRCVPAGAWNTLLHHLKIWIHQKQIEKKTRNNTWRVPTKVGWRFALHLKKGVSLRCRWPRKAGQTPPHSSNTNFSGWIRKRK